MDKVSLLSMPTAASSVEYIRAYDERYAPWADDIFLNSEGLNALKEKVREDESRLDEEKAGAFSALEDELASRPGERRNDGGFRVASLPRHRRPTSNEVSGARSSEHSLSLTLHTASQPCQRYNLQPEGCPRWNCSFSHEGEYSSLAHFKISTLTQLTCFIADLPQKEWQALRDKTKKIPCPDLKFRGKCSRGANCAFSHSFKLRNRK